MAAAAKKKVEAEIDDIDELDAPSAQNAGKDKNIKERKDKETKEKSEKEKKEKPAKAKGEKKGGALKVIIPVLLILIIGGLVAVVLLNPMGLRDRYLNGIVSQIPIVKNVLKDENAPEKTPGELANDLSAAQATIGAKDNEIARLNAVITQQETDKTNLSLEVNRLREFEGAQIAFKADKEAFDAAVANGDTVEYAKYYESIDPANAERLYQEAVITNAASKEMKNYVATFTQMDEAEAAPILETLSATDMPLVVTILKGVPAEHRAAILGQMTSASAARIVKMMSPA